MHTKRSRFLPSPVRVRQEPPTVAEAAPYYAAPCLQQQVIDAWGNARWTYVRVC